MKSDLWDKLRIKMSFLSIAAIKEGEEQDFRSIWKSVFEKDSCDFLITVQNHFENWIGKTLI